MARSQTVKSANLSDAVAKILNEYAEDFNRDLAAINVSIARETAKKLKAESRAKYKGTGYYSSGWTVTTENTRLTKKAIVHNGKAPGLPHLLEYGHLTRGGKRAVPGRPHIQGVEEEAVRLYEREVLSKL